MKYKDYIQLNEDEGGGDAFAPAGNSTDNAETDASTGAATISTLYTRLNMPQIPKEMKSQFHADLKLNGYGEIKKTKKKCKDLTPTQSEFNGDKVKAICASINDGSYKEEPILVSNDNKIVDGHHRWKANVDANKSEISTEIVDMTFDDLFKFLDNKTYVVKRDV